MARYDGEERLGKVVRVTVATTGNALVFRFRPLISPSIIFMDRASGPIHELLGNPIDQG
jgi:hypothetical protein